MSYEELSEYMIKQLTKLGYDVTGSITLNLSDFLYYASTEDEKHVGGEYNEFGITSHYLED